MYNLQLAPEQIEIRDTVRDFVAQEIKPAALKAERLDACDRSLLAGVLARASQMGLRALALSEELGGAGADHLTCCIVTEELATGDPDIAAVLAETASLAGTLFNGLMSEAQRTRFLPPFLADDAYHLARVDDGDGARLGINYHRPVADQPAPRIKAVQAGAHWILSGSADCVANAAVARLLAVEAAGADGISTLLVARDTPGLAVRAHAGAQRWSHGAHGEVTFADCRVPAENLLGSPGAGPRVRPRSGRTSPQLSALNLGIGRAAYEAALDYAGLRVQGGRRIIEHQAIGAKLADVAIRLETARAVIWQAAFASDHPQAIADRSLPDLPLTDMAAVFVSEAVYQATKDAAECFGAMGVMRDMPLQKYVQDARICRHSGAGNSEARLRVAEALASFRREQAARAIAAE